MTQIRTTTTLAWSLVAILAFACAVLIWNSRERSQDRDDEEPGDEIVRVHDQRIVETLRLHKDGKWPQAIDAWDELLLEQGLVERQRRDILRHRRNAEEAREVENKGSHEFERPVGEKRGRPDTPAPEEEFREFYPVDRQIRSVACFNVNGSGRNKGWILQGDVYFAYQYEVLMETAVKKNTGAYAVFDVYIPDVKQIRATSKEKVELRVPEIKSSIIRTAWHVTDAGLFYASRIYRVVRGLGRLASNLDPGLQRTLTKLNKYAKKAGVPLTDREDVEIVEQVESIAGRRFKVTYVRNLGVNKIEVLNGGPLTPDQLEKLAYNSSILMDYFVCPDADGKKAGDTWEVDAEHVAGLMSMDVDVETSGTLKLEHRGTTDFKGDKCYDLAVVDGEVSVAFDSDTGRQATTISPKDGHIWFSPSLRMVRGARIQWQMTGVKVSENHLLFGTTHEHNLSVESFYEAEPSARTSADHDGS